MSTVRLIRRPRSIDTHSGATSVLAVGYEDKIIAYVDKTGQLLPVGEYEGTSCCPLRLPNTPFSSCVLCRRLAVTMAHTGYRWRM